MVQGTPYLMCGPSQSPTANSPCDPGVIASDAEDGPSIQGGVLLCPPPGCQSNGCSGNRLGKLGTLGMEGMSHSAAAVTSYLPLIFDMQALPGPLHESMTPLTHCQTFDTAGEKDIPACGVDTSNSTAIGSTFLVTFVVGSMESRLPEFYNGFNIHDLNLVLFVSCV